MEGKPMDSGSERRGGGRIPWLGAAIAAVLLAAFYAAILILPSATRALLGRSIYNYRALAEQALARGDYDGAVAQIERAAREVPRDIYFERPEFMFEWIGLIRRRQNRPVESLEAYLEAQRLCFRNISLRVYYPSVPLVREIVRGYIATNNFEGACQELRAAMDLYPMVGTELLHFHEKATSRTAAGRRARDLARLDIKILNVESARSRLQNSLNLDPKLPGAHYWLGYTAELRTNTSNTAVAEYRRELANDPLCEEALIAINRLVRPGAGASTDALKGLPDGRKNLVAEFASPQPGKPLATLLQVGSKVQSQFHLDRPGKVQFNIRAASTPCDEVFGWIEVRLDGRHVQTVYVDDKQARTYEVIATVDQAGTHQLELNNLTDARVGKKDRNVVIQRIRVHRLDS